MTRDIDILSQMAELGLVRVSLSVTTLDRKLARAMEPRASTPQRRMEAIAQLSSAGIPVTMMTAPVIPGLTDREIETLLKSGAEAGARSASYVVLRLPLEIADLFREWLKSERPDAAGKIMSLVRQTRGGKDYDATFHKRGRGEGPIAALIAQRFEKARRRYGLDGERQPLRTDLFEVPLETGAQMSLF